MDSSLNKSQFNILLHAITQVSSQVDDLRAEMKHDFMSKYDFKNEMKKYTTKEDLKKLATLDDLTTNKNEIIDEVISAIQPSIAAVEVSNERHDKALKKSGLLC